MTTIFLVEDNPADVELFRMALREAEVDAELVVFEDGAEVLDFIRRPDSEGSLTAPDLMVLDLNLPKVDGLEILQIIRSTPALAQVPIAVLSSSSSSRERARLEPFHIREFISKPPDLEEYLKIGLVVRALLAEKLNPNGSSAAN